jgi:hypothetical protein
MVRKASRVNRRRERRPGRPRRRGRPGLRFRSGCPPPRNALPEPARPGGGSGMKSAAGRGGGASTAAGAKAEPDGACARVEQEQCQGSEAMRTCSGRTRRMRTRGPSEPSRQGRDGSVGATCRGSAGYSSASLQRRPACVGAAFPRTRLHLAGFPAAHRVVAYAQYRGDLVYGSGRGPCAAACAPPAVWWRGTPPRRRPRRTAPTWTPPDGAAIQEGATRVAPASEHGPRRPPG